MGSALNESIYSMKSLFVVENPSIEGTFYIREFRKRNC